MLKVLGPVILIADIFIGAAVWRARHQFLFHETAHQKLGTLAFLAGVVIVNILVVAAAIRRANAQQARAARQRGYSGYSYRSGHR